MLGLVHRLRLLVVIKTHLLLLLLLWVLLLVHLLRLPHAHLSWYLLVLVYPDMWLVWHHWLAVTVQSCENNLTLNKVRDLLIICGRSKGVSVSSSLPSLHKVYPLVYNKAVGNCPSGN